MIRRSFTQMLQFSRRKDIIPTWVNRNTVQTLPKRVEELLNQVYKKPIKGRSKRAQSIIISPNSREGREEGMEPWHSSVERTTLKSPLTIQERETESEILINISSSIFIGFLPSSFGVLGKVMIKSIGCYGRMYIILYFIMALVLICFTIFLRLFSSKLWLCFHTKDNLWSRFMHSKYVDPLHIYSYPGITRLFDSHI